MAAEGRRTAALDRAHHLHLAEAHMAGIGTTPSRSVVPKDIRNLQNWTRDDRRGLCGRIVLGLILLGHRRREAAAPASTLTDSTTTRAVTSANEHSTPKTDLRIGSLCLDVRLVSQMLRP
jgi:hypothetical protein